MTEIGWVISLIFGRVVVGKAFFFLSLFFFLGYNLVWLSVGYVL
jgi:hypothetical protein